MPCGDLDIAGKILLVTGGGSGISLAFVKLAAELKPRGIIVADLRLTDEATVIFAELKEVTSIVLQECNVAKRADLEKLFEVSKQHFQDIPDVYIAGAAVFEPAWSNWWDDTEGDDYEELRININHPLKLSRLAVRALLQHKKKKGVVLILASTGGFTGIYASPLYCASKHALIGFVRSMPLLDADEGIKIVAIAPGLVNTPLWTARPDMMAQWGYTVDRTIEPEEVARRMMELVTEGQYAGGSCLEVTTAGIRLLGEWNIAPPKHASFPPAPAVLAQRHSRIRALLDAERAAPTRDT